MSGGNCRTVFAIIDCTSCAAESISRSSENCSVMFVLPCEFTELMESMPAMVENCFSSGVATAAAIVSGLAPGRLACTWIVGKSIGGHRAPGRDPKPKDPKKQKREDDERGRDGTSNERRRQIHRVAPASATGDPWIVTRAPGVSR